MTDEEAVIKAAEETLQEAIEQSRKNQIKEHQQMMPYMVQYASELVAQSDDDPNDIHLFVITQTEDGDYDKAHNPLSMPSDPNESMVGDFTKWYSFGDLQEAIDSMGTPTSAILFNELRKQNTKPGTGMAVYAKVSDKFQMLYISGLLTVTRIQPNGDPMTKTARVDDDDPHNFFESLTGVTKDEKMLCGAVMAMCEMGGIMERQQPETYSLMLRRVRQELEGEDD